MMKEPKTDHPVKAAIWIIEPLNVLALDPAIYAMFGHVLPRQRQHRLGQIRRRHVVSLLRQVNRDPSTAARHIQHALRFGNQTKGGVDESHLRAMLGGFALLIFPGRFFVVFDLAAIGSLWLAHT